MENLVVWTLVALAVVSILLVLIVYKQKANRKDIQIESLTSTLQSDGMPVEAQPSLGPKDENRISLEIDSLSEQIRSFEITLASLQCELEVLRAENSWLKRESLADQVTSHNLITLASESDCSPGVARSPEPLAEYHRKWAPVKSGLIFPAIAVVSLVVALVGGYYTRGKTAAVPARQMETQSQTNLPTDDPKTTGTSAINPANRKSDPDSTTSASANAVAAKNRKAAPAGTFYKVVRYTRVHSQPNASSRPIAEIKPGMEIKVVAVRGEWLEVRSLYGRPPGFIRKETAVSKGVG